MIGVFSSKNLKIGPFFKKITTKPMLTNCEAWMLKRVRMGGKPRMPPQMPILGSVGRIWASHRTLSLSKAF
jgi:hypothetical protein